MIEKDWNTLCACPLFEGCERDVIPDLLDRAKAKEAHFAEGDEIPFRDRECGRIGILLDGRVAVYAAKDGRCPLNRLSPGGMFGVSSLYSALSADTVLIADTGVRILFLEEEWLDPVWENPAARKNLISFLTGRIRFLTEKIASFTAPGAEKKLARYLLAHRGEDGRVRAFRSLAELARSLNLGRASLYRAMERLEESGLVRKEGKDLAVPDPDRLSDFAFSEDKTH
ncbi:MAG: Crp/Fnr family transcriptional regulator [Clostridia bacterium]|nr:Crp/Fnr family transcriptional regulator [Clostridia bacterium]